MTAQHSSVPSDGKCPVLYLPKFADGYEWVTCAEDSEHRVFARFDGSSQAEGWRPILMCCFATEEDGPDASPADCPWYAGGALFLRTRAVEVLHDILDAAGELLPLTCTDGSPMWVWNVTNVVDALDLDRSDYELIPGTKRVLYIRRHTFLADRVAGLSAFKLPPVMSRNLFVGQSFVDRVDKSGLTGLDYTPVWSPKSGPLALTRLLDAAR